MSYFHPEDFFSSEKRWRGRCAIEGLGAGSYEIRAESMNNELESFLIATIM